MKAEFLTEKIFYSSFMGNLYITQIVVNYLLYLNLPLNLIILSSWFRKKLRFKFHEDVLIDSYLFTTHAFRDIQTDVKDFS